MSLGENIKRIRKEKNFTQGMLSEKTGIKIGHISKLENNETDPKLSTLYKLMNELDCSADELLMDNTNSSLSGIVKQAFNRIQSLPEEDKKILVNVINRYCAAENYRLLSLAVEEDQHPYHISKEDEERFMKMYKRFLENEKTQEQAD
jgi:transcriptional regulator with XRE-family HTH domain